MGEETTFVKRMVTDYNLAAKNLRPKSLTYTDEYEVIEQWNPENSEDQGIRLLSLSHVGASAWWEFKDKSSQEAIDLVSKIRHLERYMQEYPTLKMIWDAMVRANASLAEAEKLTAWRGLCCYYAIIEGLKVEGAGRLLHEASWEQYNGV